MLDDMAVLRIGERSSEERVPDGATTRPRAVRGRAGAAGIWLISAIVLAALALRPAIVAVGPLTVFIQEDTGLGSTATSLLTTVPLICLGAVAATASSLSGRIGIDRSVLAALVLLVAGIALRLGSPLSALFAGTVIAAGGIALGNVLVPAAIKQCFPKRVGVLMAVYSVALQSGAALASAVTVPVRSAFGLGWREAMALWALPAAVACMLWLPRAVRGRHSGVRAPAGGSAVWRTGLGWASGLFIGLQSGVYFALAAWLPSLLQSHGLSSDTAGYLLSVLGVAGIVGGLPVPILAARMRRQHLLVVAVSAAFAAGLLGLFFAPVAGAVLWCVLLGLAQGGGLSLALTLFTLRSRTPGGAAQLSGMAQTVGYLTAASGPFAAGWTHALSGGWRVPLLVLVAALVPFTLAGLAIAGPRYLEDEIPQESRA